MTTRQRFERWAKGRGLPLRRTQEAGRNGFRWYYTGVTEEAWRAWLASKRATS